MKELQITISGEVATGKSTMTYLLEKLLTENGFNVEISLEGNDDFKNATHLRNIISMNYNQRLDAMKEGVKITLRELQTKREDKKN